MVTDTHRTAIEDFALDNHNMLHVQLHRIRDIVASAVDDGDGDGDGNGDGDGDGNGDGNSDGDGDGTGNSDGDGLPCCWHMRLSCCRQYSGGDGDWVEVLSVTTPWC